MRHPACQVDPKLCGVNSNQHKSLLAQLAKVESVAREKRVTLKILLESLDVHGPQLLTVVLSLPFLMPIPIPGLSTPFGIVIVLLGVAIMAERTPWLPHRLLNLHIPSATLIKILQKTMPVMARLDRWLKPHWAWMTASKPGVFFHGLLIVVAAFLLTLPMPPGGNIIPAVSIIAFSLALLYDDARMTFVGVVVLVAMFVFFAEVVGLVIRHWDQITDWVLAPFASFID